MLLAPAPTPLPSQLLTPTGHGRAQAPPGEAVGDSEGPHRGKQSLDVTLRGPGSKDWPPALFPPYRTR